MTKRITALILTLLLLTGCGSPKNLAPRQTAEAGEIPDAEALMDFSLSLLRENWGENVLISPLSILCALGMTANGAAGETLAQMEAVLGVPAARLNEDLGAWMGSYAEDENLKLANSLWFRDDGSFQLEEAFLETAGSVYGAEVFPSKLNAETAGQINQWVKNHTDGMIERIAEEIPEEAVLYLINALSLDAEWENIYRQDQILDREFTTEEGVKQPAELMYSMEGLYMEDDHAQGFLKPYKGGRWAFGALLPEEGLALEDYAASLTGAHLRELLDAEETLVETAIPKFRADCSRTLNDSLTALGMPDAFDMSKADFSGMGISSAGPLYISKVLHKTSIAVDERGTKAGAVTAVAMEAGGAAPNPNTVYLTRPFLYMLVDLETNLPVFIGAVTTLK